MKVVQTFIKFVSLALIPLSFNAQSLPAVGYSISSGGFIPNCGQLADAKGDVLEEIKYYSNDVPGIYLSKKGFSYVLTEAGNSKDTNPLNLNLNLSRHRIDIVFEGANPDPEIISGEKLPQYYNFYYAHCSQGITFIHPVKTLTYKNVWPGIDIHFQLKGGGLEYDFIVHQGADPNDIQLRYLGAEVSTDLANNILTIHSKLGNIVENIPAIFQPEPLSHTKNATQKTKSLPSEAPYHLTDGKLSFNIPDYDNRLPLVIDPWATYLGGADNELLQGLCTDANNNVIATGYAWPGFPVTPGAADPLVTLEDYDAFFAKYNSSGTLLWATYYGGSYRDLAADVVTDPAGNIYGAGTTASDDFPVPPGSPPSAPTPTDIGRDAFIVKLDPVGQALWATYFISSSAFCGASDIAINSSNEIIIAGTATGAIPLLNCAPELLGKVEEDGGLNGYVAKFSNRGFLIWSGNVNGNSNDMVTSVAVDISDNVIVCGYTTSNDFVGIAGGYNGSDDGFIVKLSNECGIRGGRYFGGGSADVIEDVTTDINNNIIITGNAGPGLPVLNALYPAPRAPGSNMYIARFDSLLNLIWSTYFGGTNGPTTAKGVVTDVRGNVFVTGQTASSDFPVSPRAIQKTHGGNSDAFMSKIAATGNTLLCSSYLGGKENDIGWDIARNSAGHVLIGGGTFGDFPVRGANQPNYGGHGLPGHSGAGDAFITEICSGCGTDTASIENINGEPVTEFRICPGDSVVLQAYASGEFYWYSIPAGPLQYGNRITVKPSVTTAYYLSSLASSCPATDMANVIVEQVEAEAGPDLIAPCGKTVTIQASASGGYGAQYSYQWLSGPSLATWSGRNPGKYFVTVTDSLGCKDTDSMNVLSAEIELSFAINPETVCPGETATITALIKGGIAPINFDWNGATEGFSGPGPHTITVVPGNSQFSLHLRDADDCTVEENGEVGIFARPSARIANIPDTLLICPYSSAAINVSLKGTPPWEVSYTENNILKTFVTSASSYIINASAEGWYKITGVTDRDCDSSLADSIFVKHRPLPDVAFTIDKDTVCKGADVKYTINVTGTSPFSINGTNLPQTNFSGTSKTITLKPLSTTTYTLTKISDLYCQKTVSLDTTVIVNPALLIQSLKTDCNGTNTAFKLSVGLTGGSGAGNYILSQNNTDTPGSFSGNMWISGWLPRTSAYDLTFSDTYGCDALEAKGSRDCNCTTSAGTIDLNPLKVCEGQSAKVIHRNNHFFDDDDTLEFLLHNGSATTIGNIIYARNNTGEFSFDNTLMSFGTAYYITAVAGNKMNAGIVEFSDRCFAVSAGVEVKWYKNPSLQVNYQEVVCPGQVKVDLIPDGTQQPYNLEIDNGRINLNDISGTYSINLTLADDTSFTFSSVAYTNAPKCPQLLDEQVNIKVLGSPGAKDIQKVCSPTNEEYSVSFTISGGDPATYTVNGNLSEAVYTSVLLPIGSNYLFVLNDKDNCPQTVSGSYTCGCTTSAGSPVSTAPIILCEGMSAQYPHKGDQVSDANDTLEFVLHNGSATSIGSTIYARNNTGVFELQPPMQLNTRYFITAVAGNRKNGTEVNFADRCFSKSVGVEVKWLKIPSLTINYPDTVCPGIVKVNISNTGSQAKFDLEINNGAEHLKNISASSVLSLDLVKDTLFSFTSISYSSLPKCPRILNIPVDIKVLGSPRAENISIICSSANEEYQVSFDITGGDAESYTVNNELTGPVYTSAWIPSGSAYSFTINDKDNCPQRINGTYICKCISFAGTVLSQSSLTLCENSAAVYPHQGDHLLDANDTLEFILHNGSSTAIGNMIYARNYNGIFSYEPAMQFNTPYYITAVAGNKKEYEVDFTDKCLSKSAGVAVKWHQDPLLSVSYPDTYCPGEVKVDIKAEGSKQFFDLEIDGQPQLSKVTGTSSLLFNPAADSTFRFTAISYSDEPRCSREIDIPVSLKIAGSTQLKNTIVECGNTNESYRLSFTISGGDSGSYTVNDVSSGTDYISSWLPSGSTYHFTVSDKNNCSPQILTGQHFCPCTSFAGTVANTEVLDICSDKSAVLAHNSDARPDGNDTLEFILYEGSTGIINTVLARNHTGIFEWEPQLFFNKEYYIAAIAGNKLPGGEVNLNDPCLSKSTSVPVIFREIPDVRIQLIPNDSLCPGDSLWCKFDFTGLGPFNLYYSSDSEVDLEGLNNSGQFSLGVPATSQSYSFTKVTDGYCFRDLNEKLQVVVPQPLNINETVKQPSCSGLADGSITTGVTGGYGNYTYEWTDILGNIAGSGTSLSNLSAGKYWLEVKDQLRCTVGGSYTISDPPLYNISFIEILNETCFQSKDGEIRVAAPDGEFYEITDLKPWQTDSFFVSLSYKSGIDSLKIAVQSINGCLADTTITVEGLNPVSLVHSPDQLICAGTSVQLEVSAVGGNGGFSYFWNNVPGPALQNFMPSAPVTYYEIYAEDTKGCSSAKDTITITLPAELKQDVNRDVRACFGDTVSLTVLSGGGTGQLNSIWKNSNGAATGTGTALNFINTANVFYTITTTDTCGTSVTDTVQVKIDGPYALDFAAGPETKGCVPLQVTFASLAKGDFDNISWLVNGTVVNTYDTVFQYDFNDPGVYNISLSLSKQAAGCQFTLDKNMLIHAYITPVADFSFYPSEIMIEEPIVFTSNFSLNAERYRWTFDGNEVSTNTAPVIDLWGKNSGEFSLCLEAVNNQNCFDSLCSAITIKEGLTLYVPNTFTPDGDGHNEVFSIVAAGADPGEFLLQVFDRWGQILFESNNPHVGWDGTYKGEKLKSGMYSWKVQVKAKGETEKLEKTGKVSLLR